MIEEAFWASLLSFFSELTDLDLDGLDGFGVTVTGSHFPEVWDLFRENRLNFLFGGAGSPGQGLVGLVGLWDIDLAWPGKSDAKVGRGDELGAVEGRDDGLGNRGGATGGADKGIDIPAL
jgi:hypothetical protein